MAKICILSALLLQLLYTLVQGQNSPCPDHFTYIKKPGSDETIGLIEIRDPSINNLEVHLRIDVKVPTQLPTSFVGGINLTKPEENAARDVLEGRSLLYYIYFPVQNPLPTVHRIWFNNDQICSGSKVSGKVVTTILLEYTLKIIIQPPQNQTNPAPPQNRPAEQKSPKPSQQAPRPAPPAPVDKIENYNECGISSSSGSPNPLIANGDKTLPRQRRWVAGIVQQNIRNLKKFLCSGGTILSKLCF